MNIRIGITYFEKVVGLLEQGANLIRLEISAIVVDTFKDSLSGLFGLFVVLWIGFHIFNLFFEFDLNSI